jgi:hypothetical protein
MRDIIQVGMFISVGMLKYEIPCARSPRRTTSKKKNNIINPLPAKFIKLEPGEIEDVVQSKKGDSKDFREWSYECALAIENDEVQAAEPRNYEEVPVEKIENPARPPVNEGWRCRKCYETRFQTFCFGMNDGVEGSKERRMYVQRTSQ